MKTDLSMSRYTMNKRATAKSEGAHSFFFLLWNPRAAKGPPACATRFGPSKGRRREANDGSDLGPILVVDLLARDSAPLRRC